MAALSKSKKIETMTELEVTPLAQQMADAYWRALKARAEERVAGLHRRSRDKQQLLDAYPSNIEWHDLACAEQNEPGTSAEVYEHIKQRAREELESGHRAAVMVAGEMRPWATACYLALRDSFIEDWQPRGSIEMRLVEMLAALYTEYEHWQEISVKRVAFQCEQERYQVREKGKWREGSTTGDADTQQACEMADRYNRLFLRTLRQLRDLRRYVIPVTINHAQQVKVQKKTA